MPPCASASSPPNSRSARVYARLLSWRRAQQCGELALKTPLAPLYRADLPAGSTAALGLEFVAVDCEMTGLDARADALLSLGWVGLDRSGIQLPSARHCPVYTERPVGESATIHGLLNRDLRAAARPSAVLRDFIDAVQGKVLIFHHAPLDLAFLQAVALRLYRCPLRFGYVDTLQIERRKLAAANRDLPLNLAACRARYNLPACPQHNALSDARATAELFLAQCAHWGPPERLRLRNLGLKFA